MARYMNRISKGRVVIYMLDAITGTDAGTWFRVEGLSDMRIDVSGISGDTLQIFGSNEDTPSGDERQIGTDITANGIYTVDGPVRHIKIDCPTYSAGTIVAIMLADELKY